MIFRKGVNSLSPSSLSAPSETAISRTSWAGKKFLTTMYKDTNRPWNGLLTTKGLHVPVEGICSLLCCRGFQRGTLWHTTLRSKVWCVIRSVSVAASNAVVAGEGKGVWSGRKAGGNLRREHRKWQSDFSSGQGVYGTPVYCPFSEHRANLELLTKSAFKNMPSPKVSKYHKYNKNHWTFRAVKSCLFFETGLCQHAQFGPMFWKVSRGVLPLELPPLAVWQRFPCERIWEPLCLVWASAYVNGLLRHILCRFALSAILHLWAEI